MLTASALGAAVEDRTARGIAAAIGRLLRSGALAPGDRLPTVRDVARVLGVSPSTVSEAWQTLAQIGSIRSRGRAGTFVLDRAVEHGPVRFRRVTRGPGHYQLDLSSGTPDPALFPDLWSALRSIRRADVTSNYFESPVDEQLGEVLTHRWPFEPEAFTIVDGCLDALDRLVTALVGFGDRVVVENPTFAPLLDLLHDAGAEVVPVDMDEHGPRVESFLAALTADPTVIFLQPRAQNPAGVVLDEPRARELAAAITGSRIVIVEDDHAGDASGAPLVSLGRWLPEQTVHIRGFSKSHGPDLRLAAIGGAGGPVDMVVSRRRLGPGWSSRILQRALASMLRDPDAVAQVDRARVTYGARRAAMADALGALGVRVAGSDGFYLWVPVRDEQRALIRLASTGIGASPGTPFLAGPLDAAHIRVTVSRVQDGVAGLAEAIADAAQA